MCEARLAVQSNGENAAGYRNVHLSFLEFGRVFLIVCADDLLRRLLPGELVRVRVKSQTRYLFQFFLALQKLIARFEFQAALRFSLSRAQYTERVRKASRKRRDRRQKLREAARPRLTAGWRAYRLQAALLYRRGCCFECCEELIVLVLLVPSLGTIT